MPTITPGPHGLITTDQAAALCGVSPVTVRSWINRGWKTPGGLRKLPVAWRYKGRIMLDPVEVAKADHATREKARRVVVRSAA
jgi:hypothetical protein